MTYSIFISVCDFQFIYLNSQNSFGFGMYMFLHDFIWSLQDLLCFFLYTYIYLLLEFIWFSDLLLELVWCCINSYDLYEMRWIFEESIKFVYGFMWFTRITNSLMFCNQSIIRIWENMLMWNSYGIQTCLDFTTPFACFAVQFAYVATYSVFG